MPTIPGDRIQHPPPGDAALISIEGVSAGYGSTRALSGISFSVGAGVCALLGPNGAGKTTLLNSVVGVKRFVGRIEVGGRDVRPVRPLDWNHGVSRVGYLPQTFSTASTLSVDEVATYAAWCNGLKRRAARSASIEALETVDLLEKKNAKVRTLSGGERQRLGLACAIAHRPSTLLLDEPTVGLDPAQRANLRNYLARVARDRCVILATHLLEDVRMTAERVVILAAGRVVFDGTTSELAAHGGAGRHDMESDLESGYRRLVEGSDG